MTTVDDELFPSLQDAIDFVASCGGGIVFSEQAGTLFGNSLKLPATVRLETPRAAEEIARQPMAKPL